MIKPCHGSRCKCRWFINQSTNKTNTRLSKRTLNMNYRHKTRIKPTRSKGMAHVEQRQRWQRLHKGCYTRQDSDTRSVFWEFAVWFRYAWSFIVCDVVTWCAVADGYCSYATSVLPWQKQRPFVKFSPQPYLSEKIWRNQPNNKYSHQVRSAGSKHPLQIASPVAISCQATQNDKGTRNEHSCQVVSVTRC